jgi:sugar phosphate isomerase/epimerase
MPLGVFSRTYALAGTDAVFSQAARDGFSAIQLNLSTAGLASLPEHCPSSLADEVVASANRHGLSLCALSGTYNMAHPDAARRKADRIGFANVVRAAQRMKVPLVTLCTGTRDAANQWAAHPDNASAQAWIAMREELDFALELAERHDIALGVEPEPANVVSDAVVARRLLDEVASPRLKIVLDAANLLSPGKLQRQREVVAEATALLGGDLALVHTKDIGPCGEHVAAGKGVVDLRVFLEGVLSTGYRGPLVSHNFPVADAPHAAGYLRRLLDEIASCRAAASARRTVASSTTSMKAAALPCSGSTASAPLRRRPPRCFPRLPVFAASRSNAAAMAAPRSARPRHCRSTSSRKTRRRCSIIWPCRARWWAASLWARRSRFTWRSTTPDA